MIYIVKFLPEAQGDLKDIHTYLSQFYEGTAGRFFSALKISIENLKSNPFMAQVYTKRLPYRRLIVGDYIVLYKIDENKTLIEIHRILHGSRDINRYI